jgi:YVTN family beta-propeller protein
MLDGLHAVTGREVSVTRSLVLAVATVSALVFGTVPSWAQNAYITNSNPFSPNNSPGTVSVIATSTNTAVGAPITVGHQPSGVAVTPDGSKVYVANTSDNTVSVISTATNQVTATVPVGTNPVGAAATPDGSSVYVTNEGSGNVYVISTATDQVIAIVAVGAGPFGVAVTPDGDVVYVANVGSNNVSVIATATNTVVDTIPVGTSPQGVAINPNGTKIYVANASSNNVSVITRSVITFSRALNFNQRDTVSATVAVGAQPFGVAVTPDGGTVYVTNSHQQQSVGGSVSVIAASSNTVTQTITVGNLPFGVAVTPDGSKVYVANMSDATVSVISTASNMATGTVTVGSNPYALGNFIGPPTLTVAEAGNGSGQVTSSPSGINCSAGSNQCTAMFVDETQVTLTASASAGSTFGGWSSGGCSGTDPCVITPTVDTTVTAIFNQVPSFTLSVAPTGTGSGTVTSSPSGINCGATCSASFATGAHITLTASAAASSTFAGWSGGGCTGTGTCQVTMNAAESVTATFTLNPPVTLTVTEAGSGAGQITSNPAGINCSASSNQCAAPFAVGTQVTLTASASAGSSFAGWSGGGCSGTNTCQVTMSAAQSVTATFNVIPSFMLSVVPSGNGSGTVTSSPSGINCGGTCAASFQSGTQVILSATAASGSTFVGWSSGGCGGDQSCTVTLGANTAVTASFVSNTVGNLTLVAAVLPLSRSVELGATPTAFATMINAGPADATTCTIAPATGIPASFLFQTTNPSTNAVTGTANTPVNIAAGQPQSFVIAFTPNAAFPPTNVAFTFTCANAPSPAATIIGVDTLNLSASTTPVPDVVALAASGDPGFVDIPGTTGTGVFAVATVNLGADATITASANTGSANLPVTLSICETNPTSGACLATPAASVTTDIQPNATPTFGIFVTGSAAVANLPGVNRVFVAFTDGAGTLRGETSVAVRTQ